jgi:hypothetical protein
MFKNSWPLAMLAALAASTTIARAHEIVGNRFFPATLAIDDPGVTDELSIPTIPMSKTGDDPSFKQLDVQESSQNASPRILPCPSRQRGRGFTRPVDPP